MKTTLLSLAACLLIAGASGVTETAGAQASTRAYREGPVIQVSYIRTKPGMFDRYMQYLDGAYKTNLEAQKAAGIVLDYGIYVSDPRTPTDHDILLTVVYKNWGALDNLADRSDAIVNRALQSTPEQRAQQFIDRGAMRESLGSRTYQQLLLK
ncbi:MAG TPA: hypothetical protein VJV97_08445 [Gemmatimonadaceae bacterium]|nr:hypothetical protein [Gemmatimonadaceae bacterium]